MNAVMVSKRAEFLRRARQSMLCLLAVSAFIVCNGSAADEQEKTQQRDGAWLQNGVNQNQRLNAHGKLSDKQVNDALVVRSYVCAVVDLEKNLTLRADLLAAAVREGKKQHHMNPEKLNGMAEALPILIPLMQTKFSTDSPPCDTAVLIVRDYLAKYPEVLAKDADVIIEKALLDAYSNISELQVTPNGHPSRLVAMRLLDPRAAGRNRVNTSYH